MAIFDSVLFEGQQADEYKARKEKEKADKKAAEKANEDRRYNRDYYYGDSYAYQSPGHKKMSNSFFSEPDNSNLYRGEGNRRDYMLIGKDDSDRSDKANKMVRDEKDKRYSEYDHKNKEYYDASSKARESEVNKPRPRGLFKGKEKKEYDARVDAHNKDVEVRDKKEKESNNARDSYYRIRHDEERAVDAANRHIRRHPKQYKESVGIFESVELV